MGPTATLSPLIKSLYRVSAEKQSTADVGIKDKLKERVKETRRAAELSGEESIQLGTQTQFAWRLFIVYDRELSKADT